MKHRARVVASCTALALLAFAAHAQQRPWQRALSSEPQAAALPSGVRVLRDVAYGSDSRQRFDVYLPATAPRDAPVIFLVHGGAWAFGDKAAAGVVANKVARWVPRGFIVVSTDYRMLPQAAPLEQAADVALALATAQRMAPSWGGDPGRFIVMGHSAGAHLVALLSAEPSLAQRQGVRPWLGTIALDSACLDVVQTMQRRHLPLYDRAFGSDPAGWLAASPYQQLHGRIVPLLAVCSTRRSDSCPAARAFVARAQSFGAHAEVLPEDLSHMQIDHELGQSPDYTRQVERFMAQLDPAARALLRGAGA